jgi:hypothetical protein
VSGHHPWPPPSKFRKVTNRDFYGDEPLKGNPAFDGGILEADSLTPEEAAVMDIETKEIREAPSTEEKNADLKSGTLPPRRYADSRKVATRSDAETSQPSTEA